MELKESVKKLPKQPGIYFMKNSLGTVLYVGKAKNLKARVFQYFQKKGYQYIKISINEDYPKISIVTTQKKDGSVYYGPFTSKGSVANTIEFMKDYYPIRNVAVVGLGIKIRQDVFISILETVWVLVYPHPVLMK